MVDNFKGKTLDYTQGATSQPPEITEPPSGNKVLTAEEKWFVGIWGATIPGSYHGDMYYIFYQDGTFKEARVGRFLVGYDYLYSTIAFSYGNWHVSGGSLYLTNRMATIWNVRSQPNSDADGYKADGVTPNNLTPWSKHDDYVWRDIIRFEEGEVSYDNNAFDYRLFYATGTWEGTADGYPAPKFRERDRLPSGSIKDAFEHIHTP